LRSLKRSKTLHQARKPKRFFAREVNRIGLSALFSDEEARGGQGFSIAAIVSVFALAAMSGAELFKA